MSIHIVSFDIGKKNFAFSISKVYKSRINKLTKFPKKERYNVDGTTTPDFEKELKKLYKCSQTVLVRNYDLTNNCNSKLTLDPQTYLNMVEVLDKYSGLLEDYSSKLYVPNNLKTQLLESSLELRGVDPYFTTMTRTVMRKLERAEQLLRIVYGNGVYYYEQEFGISYIPPYIPN